MQIQQLVYFMKIAELGSMNKAAAELLMTQPNLSRAMMNLEDELGIEIELDQKVETVDDLDRFIQSKKG